jgi:hypothetical protein
VPSTESAVQAITGPQLLGVYLHDPEDPQGTIRQFLYAPSGKTEKRAVASEMLVFAGRTRPVAEFGDAETDTLDVTLVVPWDDSWYGGTEALRSIYRTFRTYAYRDSRGRSWYGVLRDVQFEDVKEGTKCVFTFERTYYSAVPASLAVTQVQQGN